MPFGDARAAELAIDRDCAAFIVEPIQGEGGVNVPPPGYLAALRRFCDAVGALLIFDEVQTGIGRTGRMFALEHEGVVPDVVTLGKGLGGGFPVGAFLTSEAVAATVALGDHGTTFGGSPLACAAANAVLRVIEAEKLVERAAVARRAPARAPARLRARASGDGGGGARARPAARPRAARRRARVEPVAARVCSAACS